jgi:hypothetical protein
LRERIDELRDRAGRHVKVTASGAKPDRETVEAYSAAGADACTFYVPSDADRGEVERRLDELATLA